jgi:hypothetical protein
MDPPVAVGMASEYESGPFLDLDARRAVYAESGLSPPLPEAAAQSYQLARLYDASLRRQRSLAVWFTDEAIAAWAAEPRTTRGGQAWYSPLAILTAADHHPEAAVIVPPRRTAVLSEMASIAPKQRDRHPKCIEEKGRMGWQKA